MTEVVDEAQMMYLQMLLDNGCTFLFKTEIPQGGWAQPKPYVFMKDRTGAIFLERIPDAPS